MNTLEEWKEVEGLFHKALKLDPAQRKPFLEKACKGRPDLQKEVIALLESHDKTENFLETPVAGFAASLFTEDDLSSLEGALIGSYRIIREIGSGGMGRVYLAERADEQYQKKVAVKVIKKGMDTEEIHRRFLNERQILAEFEHPNIARLLDGGVTDDGRPYFVMEYVEGLPLLEYCDTHRLSTEKRLELFCAVCDAVQYAHQNLVVHRDLKPANVLVTPAGVPKLLDFGIAKLLDPAQTGFVESVTRTQLRMMTPDYASPEQAKGMHITTASDIYSLGVFLYELLTGHHPYHITTGSLQMAEQIISKQEPPKPSIIVTQVEEVETTAGKTKITPAEVSRARNTRPEVLHRRLNGDLDNIVMMALRKEPQRRYSSVSQFTEDIRRHLKGLPVIAAPDRFAYRFTKFIKRNKVGVIAAFLIFLAIVLGFAATLWQNRIARQQRDLAVHAANTMVFELAEGLSRMTGPTESRLGLLTQAADVFEAVNRSSLASTGSEHQSVAANRVLSQTYRLLGNAERSLVHATLAEEQAEKLVAKDETEIQNRILLCAALVELGYSLVANGRDAQALMKFDEAVRLGDKLLSQAAAFPQAQRWVCAALIGKADQLYYVSKFDSAGPLYQQAFDITNELLQHDQQNIDYQLLHATTTERLGDVLYYSGKVGESCVKYREALGIREKTVEMSSNNPQVLRSLSISMQNSGWCAEQEDDIDEAVRLYQESIAIQRRLLTNDPSNIRYATALMGGYGTLANLHQTRGNIAAAVDNYQKALRIGEDFINRGISNAALSIKIAKISELYARALIRKNRLQEASQVLKKTTVLLENLIGQEPANTDYLRTLANVLISEGKLFSERGKERQGLGSYRRALEIRREISGQTGMSYDSQLEAYTYYFVGKTLKKLSRIEEAKQALSAGRQILIGLRSSGKLSENSEGARDYLPAIEKCLKEIETK